MRQSSGGGVPCMASYWSHTRRAMARCPRARLSGLVCAACGWGFPGGRDGCWHCNFDWSGFGRLPFLISHSSDALALSSMTSEEDDDDGRKVKLKYICISIKMSAAYGACNQKRHENARSIAGEQSTLLLQFTGSRDCAVIGWNAWITARFALFCATDSTLNVVLCYTAPLPPDWHSLP